MQCARQELSQERSAHADAAHRAASAQEEQAGLRRQLNLAVRQANDAKEEAAEAVAQRRAAERQLQSTEQELALSRAGVDAHRRDEEEERRASTELLGAASRDRLVQAEVLERNVAAFESLVAQKDEQLGASASKLADMREQLEKRAVDVTGERRSLRRRTRAPVHSSQR